MKFITTLVGLFPIIIIYYNMKKSERIKVFLKCNGRCAYCGCSITSDRFHVDHIQPKYRNTTQEQLKSWNSEKIKGEDSIDNYNPSCISCNLSKSTFTIEQWRKELELKKERIKRDSPTFNILLRFKAIVETNNPIVFYFETI